VVKPVDLDISGELLDELACEGVVACKGAVVLAACDRSGPGEALDDEEVPVQARPWTTKRSFRDMCPLGLCCCSQSFFPSLSDQPDIRPVLPAKSTTSL